MVKTIRQLSKQKKEKRPKVSPEMEDKIKQLILGPHGSSQTLKI